MCSQKQSDMETFLDTLAKLAIQELRDKQKFEIPGIVLIKNNYKPERKGGRIQFLGQKFNVKAKAARYIVKAYPIFPLKRDVEKISGGSSPMRMENKCWKDVFIVSFILNATLRLSYANVFFALPKKDITA